MRDPHSGDTLPLMGTEPGWTAGNRISGIVLAAGASSRMGGLKQLLPIGGVPAVALAAGRLLSAGIEDVLVVVGYRNEEVAAAVASLPVRVVMNEDFESGMLSSIVCGVRAISPEARAFFLLPADIPLVMPGTLGGLARAMLAPRDGSRESPDVVYPCHEGCRGHPPLVSTALKDGILAWDGPGGLGGFLKGTGVRSQDLEVDDPGILMDMDTPADYARLIRYYGDAFQDRLHRGAERADGDIHDRLV